MAENKTTPKTETVFVTKSPYETGEGQRGEIVSVNGVRRTLLCDRNNITTPAVAAEYKNRVALRTMAMRNMAAAKEKMRRKEAEADNPDS